MEIERKFLIPRLPDGYEKYHCLEIEQGYLSTSPVVRVRRQGDSFYLTYKSAGLLARQEYNLSLTEESYLHLRAKCDGNLIAKTRYLLPVPGETSLTVELDVFHGAYEGLFLAEVEFPSVEAAEGFTPLSWFGEDVTMSGRYQNSRLSAINPRDL